MSRMFGIFASLKNWKKGDLPLDSTVEIVVLNSQSSDGRVSISSSLCSDAEIDYAIDALQKDLETVRRDSKRALKFNSEKVRSLLRDGE